MMFLRARSLSSGATASSQSRKMMSAADFAAFSNSAGLEPGTASSERCRRGLAGSMVVKLMDGYSWMNARGLSGAAETGGNAVDRKQQRRLVGFSLALTPRATVTAQQLDLLAIGLRDARQLARQADPELREPLGDLSAATDPQQHFRRQTVLALDGAEDCLAHGRLFDQTGVFARDLEIGLQQGLFGLIHDQAEQSRVLEHAPQQQQALLLAHFQERREAAADTVPARHHVTILRPGEHPGYRTQIRQGIRTEAARGTRTDIEQRQLRERARRLQIGDQIGALHQLAIGR